MDKSKYINKVKGHALIDGGSGGIGSECVRGLVANGAEAITITFNSNEAKARKVATEIEAEGVRVYVDRANPLDVTEYAAFLERAVAFHGGMDISTYVNAVGWSPNTPIEEQTVEEHRKVMDINLHGPFFATRTNLVRMRTMGIRGSVVLITSTNGINSNSPISSHYDASKAGLVPHIRNFGTWFAPHGMRVNGVAPGWIETPMNDTLPLEERERESAKIWIGRWAEPHEVANMVVAVAGSTGSYVTGTNIIVDGGY
ncbi:MAG TPA: SDR family oxidoreductase [Candidatus Paceibacterota bacterium]|nr:SDR family oxidoreductase [Candidatus Paceibacterota bacterium]